MPNLLPPEEKKKLLNDYRIRVASFYLGCFFVLICFAGVLLLPSYMLSRSKLKDKKTELQILKESVSYRESRNIEEELQKTAMMIEALEPYIQTESVEEVLKLALKNKTSGVDITTLSFRKVDAESLELVVSGVASTRSALIAFSENLKKQPEFSKVDLPLSSLASTDDVEFSITLSISKQQ